jgi:hypothetical protein
MMNSSLTNNENSTHLPSLLMGEGEGGGDMVYSPSPQPSPTKGEGDNWDYFLSNTNGFIGFISRFRNEFGMTFKFLLSC